MTAHTEIGKENCNMWNITNKCFDRYIHYDFGIAVLGTLVITFLVYYLSIMIS